MENGNFVPIVRVLSTSWKPSGKPTVNFAKDGNLHFSAAFLESRKLTNMKSVAVLYDKDCQQIKCVFSQCAAKDTDTTRFPLSIVKRQGKKKGINGKSTFRPTGIVPCGKSLRAYGIDVRQYSGYKTYAPNGGPTGYIIDLVEAQSTTTTKEGTSQ